jgi:hypothetical protein
MPSNAIIDSNRFINNTVGTQSGGAVVHVFSSPVSTIVSCNLFNGNMVPGEFPPPGGVVRVDYNNDQVTINNNNILANPANYDIAVGSWLTSLNAMHNFWGTTDPSVISERIYDYYDDFSLIEVLFTPFLTAPSPCAPMP